MMGRRARALLAAGAFASGCSKQGTLWLENGLEVPVRVQVTGQPPVELQPDEHRVITVPSGRRSLETTTLDGKGRERAFLDVPRGGAAVYSVAGAAALFIRTDFSAPGGGDPPEPRFDTLCGQQTFAGKIDRYFEPPPEGLVSSGTITTLVAAKGGWKTCVNLLEQRGQDKAAAGMLPAVRLMHSGEGELWTEAELRALSGDEAGALALLRAAAVGPDAERTYRSMYSQLGQVLGRRAELERELQKLAERDPGNLEWRYQLARMLPAPGAVQQLQALARERPDDADIRMSLAWGLAASSRFPEALAALGPLGDGGKLTPAQQIGLVSRRVWNLAALGRYPEAIQAIQADRTESQHYKVVLLVLQGLMAGRLGRPDLEPDLAATELGRDPWVSALYDTQVHPERLDQARLNSLKFGNRVIHLLLKARVEPKEALRSLHRFTSFESQFIPGSVAFLLIGEAWRVGDEGAAAALRRPLLRSSGDLGALRAYVLEGRRSRDSDDLFEDCAAIHLARSRVLRGRGDVLGAAAEERLVRHDPYGGPATRALREWPPVAPGSAPPPPGATQLASAKAQAPQRSRDPRAPQPSPKPGPVEHQLIRVEGVTLEREP